MSGSKIKSILYTNKQLKKKNHSQTNLRAPSATEAPQSVISHLQFILVIFSWRQKLAPSQQVEPGWAHKRWKSQQIIH